MPAPIERLRARLAHGETVFGTMLLLADSARWAQAICRLPFDFVIVDTEHAALDRATVADLHATFDASGLVSLTRVPDRSPTSIRMALDAGAHGVLVPYCETVAEVRAAVGAARYRLLQGRALEQVLESDAFEESHPALRTALREQSARTLVMIGIESAAGIDALPEMLQVGGIDAVHVGPYDLSATLGVPGRLEAPEVQRAFERVLEICKAERVPVAIWPLPVTMAEAWLRRGVSCVIHSTDLHAMLLGFRTELERLRAAAAPLGPPTSDESE